MQIPTLEIHEIQYLMNLGFSEKCVEVSTDSSCNENIATS